MRGSTGDPITVLHVDDQRDYTELTATVLEDENDRITVETATSPAAGLEIVSEGEIDCIVSDYDMPETNGIEFLQSVRETNPELPFILYTGKGSEEVASDAISAGVTDYLQKSGGKDQYTVLANRITNAVEARYAQREQQRQLDAIETAQEGITILDNDGYFIHVNEAYATLYGYEPEELIGEHWAVLYPDSDVRHIRENILPCVRETGHWHGRTTGLRADGSTFVEDHVLAVTDNDELVCSVRDITGRMQAQEELERKNDLFEQAQEIANLGAWETDLRTDEGWWTEQVNDIYGLPSGYEPEPGEGVEYFHPDDQAKVQAAYERAIETGEPYDLKLRVAGEDGKRRWVHIRGVPQFEDGEVAKLRGTIQDITPQKEREEELQKEREFIEQSLNALDDIFYLTTPEGNFERWNETLPAVSGYSNEEIASMNALEFFDGEHRDRIREAIQQILQTGSDVTEAAITTKDGRQVPHEFRGVRMTDSEGEPTGIIGISRNITERKEREQELKRQNELLSEFAGVVSHDLRNPLNVAFTSLDLAKEECDSEHLGTVERSLGRMSALIEDLLTLAKEGDVGTSPAPTDIETVAEDSWATVETKEATLVLDVDCTVQAETSRLKQLFENLVRNAVEHAGPETTVTVGELESGFFVADDGPGIPAESRSEVTDAGYSTATDGTGFGLSIVKQIADTHGWNLCITESTAGGARFEFTDVTFASE